MAKEFFEDMGRVIYDTVEDLGKMTGEAVEVQKLKAKRYTLKKNTNKVYRELGRLVYSKFETSEPIDPEYVDLCENIQKLELEVKELEKEIGEIKGMENCKHCDTPISKEDVFCKRCGTPTQE